MQARDDRHQFTKMDFPTSQSIAQFQDDGKLLISFPKSGRTWLRYAFIKHDIQVIVSHAGTSTNWREIGRLAPEIEPLFANRRFVFLHRNAIDTAVSMFYQIHKRDLRPWGSRWLRMIVPLALRGALPPRNIDDFVLDPHYGVPKICAFNRKWLDHMQSRKDCMAISYEDLRAQPAQGFQTILDFFGITDVDGASLANTSSFERMKKAERQGSADDVLKSDRKGDQTSAKVRKGKVGGYVDELSAYTIAKCHAIIAEYGLE